MKRTPMPPRAKPMMRSGISLVRSGSPECSVEGCTKSARKMRSLHCEMHYMRLRRNGTLDTVRTFNDGPCSVKGCEDDARALTLCQKHYLRQKVHGDVNFECVGPNHPGWTGDEASYAAVHQRLRRERGSASKHSCVDCGNQAKQWSYDRRGGQVEGYLPHEADLDRYEPRCIPCHKKFDNAYTKPTKATGSQRKRDANRIQSALRPQLKERAEGHCELCGVWIDGDGQLHHRLRRGGPDRERLSNYLWVHGPTCHLVTIEQHPERSRANGWILSAYQDPASSPVMYRGHPMTLTDSGLVLPITSRKGSND